jgi:glucose-6-phosphate 1-epimerase
MALQGPSAEILFWGATVISWKSGSSQNPTATPIERLFVSSKSKLDGSKPVRGGIPIVFPCFGAPVHPEHLQLGQHGFARNETWEWSDVVMDNDAGVSVRFTLGPTPKIQAVYKRSFQLAYVVTLAEHQLSTDLHVENTSEGIIEFQALLHNYIQAPANEVSVTPLQHLAYFDKTDLEADGHPKQKVESRSAVDVRNSTDSVYENAPQSYQVEWTGGGIKIRSVNLKDVVVWNPQEDGRKMADMEEDGWKKYVCIEPGFVRGFVKLEPNARWIGQQVMTVI